MRHARAILRLADHFVTDGAARGHLDTMLQQSRAPFCGRFFTILAAPTLALFAACDGAVLPVSEGVPTAVVPPTAEAADGSPQDGDAVGATTASKVDLLLVVDNSASMGEKAKALAASVGTLIHKIALAGDVHVGVITSSLGSMGGDICAEESNGLAHLRTTGSDGAVVRASGVLSYGPGGDVDALVRDTEALVKGAGETGCGLEAQLESAYRFLVQPDPWARIAIDQDARARYEGVDATVLAQRKAFLRPDSLVVVVMLTDEDDSSVDPRAIGGQGFAFSSTKFPGSGVFRSDGVSTTAPRATSACATNPADPACKSCALAVGTTDPECQKNGGYYGPTEDSLNIRFHRMKQRFGVDPQFPISRYVNGFGKQRVPSRDGEHVETAREIGPYLGHADCTNPLFAASLPGGPSEELCNLPPGPRGKDLVVFALIGGIPEHLASATPDWRSILGANPEAYDFTGQDPHMVPSPTPRPGLPGPSSTPGDNGPDAVHGREWDTGNEDLQYACTFALPAVRTCSSADTSCDCAGSKNPPLCSAAVGQQLRGKAYPTLRELEVVKGLGDRGIVGSICPTDAAVGYVSTMNTLAERVAPRLKK